MRYTHAEKLDIRLVETSDLPVKRTLEELGVPRSTFYRWYERYRAAGNKGLAGRQPGPRQFWNKIPTAVREHVVEARLDVFMVSGCSDTEQHASPTYLGDRFFSWTTGRDTDRSTLTALRWTGTGLRALTLYSKSLLHAIIGSGLMAPTVTVEPPAIFLLDRKPCLVICHR